MDKREAKNEGRTNGESAAVYCEVSDADRRQAECECVAPNECVECIAAAAFEAESGAREFSPFEFFAHDVNECGDRADGLWEAYDAGVAIGIFSAARKRSACRMVAR